MTEEEYFRKNYPDSCYGDKPLSPHFDFFQDGVEFGERQSEKRIDELEKENAELQQKWLNESYEKAKLVEKWKHNGENIIQECKDIEGAKTYYEHKLTKAKELLNMFLRLHYSPIVDEKTLFDKVENFLKDSEVEK